MLDTGARANEVCQLPESDVNWSQRLAKVYGKGAKERYVPFSAATMKAIQRYMVKARERDCDRLFQNEEGKPLSTSGLLQLCNRLGEKAGVELNPHKFRHTFAISYLRSGASVFALQKTLGHSSLDMSLRYAALVTEDLVNDHAKHSPVAALISGKR
jgi:site-specific recombinase XerD